MSDINLLDALGDPTRRKLFERLRLGECSVSELVQVSGVSQPAVSQHLKVLREAGLVQVEVRRQQRIYRLDPAGVHALRRYIESFWEPVLLAYQQMAETIRRKEMQDE
jgi:DNA-binding transcriptional ArsR family regulator